eukprot:14057950-Ditylum_brightwellii.AAC.1
MLEVHFLHQRRSNRLNGQWQISTDINFNNIKNNCAIAEHLERYGMYTRHVAASSKLGSRLVSNKSFDLHMHLVKLTREGKSQTTKALVMTYNKSKTRMMKNVLCKMNNKDVKAKSKWPQTGLQQMDTIVKPSKKFGTKSMKLYLLLIELVSGTQIFHNIDEDSNRIQHFCTLVEMKDEAITWIDNLEQHINDNFSEKEMEEITNGEEIG